MTREELTKLVLARISPKGEEAGGVFLPHIYAATDKAAKSLAAKIAASDRRKELQKSFEVTVTAGAGTLPAEVLLSFIDSITVNATFSGTRFPVSVTYRPDGYSNELFYGPCGFSYQASFAAQTFGFVETVETSQPPSFGNFQNYTAAHVVEHGVQGLIAFPNGDPNCVTKTEEVSPTGGNGTRSFAWYDSAGLRHRSATAPRFPLRFYVGGPAPLNLVVFNQSITYEGGPAFPAPSLSELLLIENVNQPYYVLSGGKIHLRLPNEIYPNTTVTVRANYVPTVENFPAVFDEDLIEEVILIMAGGGGANG